MNIPGATNASHQDAPNTARSIPNGYAIVPHAVARDASLSISARMLYLLLDGRQGSSDGTRVRIETLAADMGVSVSTVKRCLRELRQAGLVESQITGRSLMLIIHNTARKRVTADPDRGTSGPSAGSPVTSLQRSNQEKNNQSRNNPSTRLSPGSHGRTDRDPMLVSLAAANPLLPAYVDAIASATGLPLKPTNDVLQKVQKIAFRGMTPAAAGEAAHGQMIVASGMRDIRNPVAFLAKTVLDALADDPHAAPVEAVVHRQATRTPIPEPYTPPERLPDAEQGEVVRVGAALVRDALRAAMGAEGGTRG